MGGSVQARALAALCTQNLSAGATGRTGFSSGTDHFADVGGPAGTSHEKWGSSGEIIGTTSVGWNFGSGSNTQRAMVATAWTEGAPLVTPRSRAYVLATLPGWLWTAGL